MLKTTAMEYLKKEGVNIVFIINGLSLLLGIAVFVWASLVLGEGKLSMLLELLKNGDIHASGDDLSNIFYIVCIVSIVVGVGIVVVAILGYFGAYNESPPLTAVYLFLAALITLLALAFAIISIVFAERVHEDTKPVLKSRISKEYTEKQSDSYSFSDAINNAQVWLKCCGIDSYTDYNNADKWDHNNGTYKIPLTCCVLKNPDDYYERPCAAIAKFATCQTDPTDTNSYYKKSCADALLDEVKRNSWILGGLWFGVVFIQILCIAFIIYLCRSYGDNVV